MLTRTELERLAGMGNQLRPDWPVASLLTHLRTHHTARAYRDVAVALAYVATDPITQTPARMLEAGPWWRTTEESRATPTGRRVPCPEHPDQPAGRCRPCADAKATPDQIRAARAHGRRLAAAPVSAYLQDAHEETTP